jgi:hypothetical protein
MRSRRRWSSLSALVRATLRQEEWMTVREAAALYRVTDETMLAWVRAGGVPNAGRGGTHVGGARGARGGIASYAGTLRRQPRPSAPYLRCARDARRPGQHARKRWQALVAGRAGTRWLDERTQRARRFASERWRAATRSTGRLSSDDAPGDRALYAGRSAIQLCARRTLLFRCTGRIPGFDGVQLEGRIERGTIK